MVKTKHDTKQHTDLVTDSLVSFVYLKSIYM